MKQNWGIFLVGLWFGSWLPLTAQAGHRPWIETKTTTTAACTYDVRAEELGKILCEILIKKPSDQEYVDQYLAGGIRTAEFVGWLRRLGYLAITVQSCRAQRDLIVSCGVREEPSQYYRRHLRRDHASQWQEPQQSPPQYDPRQSPWEQQQSPCQDPWEQQQSPRQDPWEQQQSPRQDPWEQQQSPRQGPWQEPQQQWAAQGDQHQGPGQGRRRRANVDHWWRSDTSRRFPNQATPERRCRWRDSSQTQQRPGQERDLCPTCGLPSAVILL